MPLENIVAVAIVVNSVAQVVHIIIDERHKREDLRWKQSVDSSFQQLVTINNTYLPWMYERFSEQEKQLLDDILNEEPLG